jgi:hypothetical protein
MDKGIEDKIRNILNEPVDVLKAIASGSTTEDIQKLSEESLVLALTKLVEKETEGHKHTCGRCGDEFWTAHYLETDSPLCGICFKGLTNCKSVKERDSYLSTLSPEQEGGK